MDGRPLTAEQVKVLRSVPVTPQKPNRLKFAMALVTVRVGEVAKATGLTLATVSDIRNFKYADLKHSTVQRIAEFFGVFIEDIFPSLAAAAVSAQARQQRPLPFRKAVAR